MGVAVLVGTRKGLFVLTSDENRRDWKVEGPHLTGWEVFHAMRDPRDGTLHAATNNWVYGATAHRSKNLGQTWERAEGIGLPEESGLTWEKSWHFEPGHADEPETLWLGGTPAALFKAIGAGETWKPVRRPRDPARGRHRDPPGRRSRRRLARHEAVQVRIAG